MFQICYCSDIIKIWLLPAQSFEWYAMENSELSSEILKGISNIP